MRNLGELTSEAFHLRLLLIPLYKLGFKIDVGKKNKKNKMENENRVKFNYIFSAGQKFS